MIRHAEQEQLHRLTVKTLDQVFIARAQEGLGRYFPYNHPKTDITRNLSA